MPPDANLKIALDWFDAPTVVEIGSHEGDTVRYIQHVKPKATILAVEADPTSYNTLKKTGAICYNLAISDHNGDVKFATSKYSRVNSLWKSGPKHKTSNVDTIKVPCMTMDEFMGDFDIDIVRLDCYGAEYKIFEASTKWLERTKVISMTMHTKPAPFNKYGKKRSAIMKKLTKAGFHLISTTDLTSGKHIHQLWRRS